MFITFQKLLPKRLLSRFMSCLAHSRCRPLKNWAIRVFCRHFEVDLAESVITDFQQFPSFNDFFIRELKPGVRPLPTDPHVVACPVDGAISELGPISQGKLLQAKGEMYSLTGLLGGEAKLSQLFQNGKFLTVYLAPKNYHRVHMPITGKLIEMRYMPGKLFSVNPTSVKGIPGLFNRNERVICLFETKAGPMAVILVAAMLIGGVVTRWAGRVMPQTPSQPVVTDYTHSDIVLKQGDELGYFEWGSTVILLFGPQGSNWNSDLCAGKSTVMGQSIGKIKAQP